MVATIAAESSSPSHNSSAMTKAAALLVAAMFAFGSLSAVAQDKKDAPKKPSAEECKKDPKMAGCETKDEMKKDAKKEEKK